MDTTKELTAIEWCAGYGGIHLGLKRAISGLRVIAYGEIEAFACANLVSKMEAGLLDAAPLWTDIKTFPCEEFRDRVGLLVAGYPCQPFSAAGKRLGADDPRHLWPHILRAIGIIRPRLCFFENVEGHISLGLCEVLGDLGAAGYTAAWGIFSASEVGAPHQRKRVFILAYDQRERVEELGRQIAVGWELNTARDDGGVANALCERRQQIPRSASCNEEADGGARRDEQQQNSNHLAPSYVQGIAWPSQLADAGCEQPQGWGDFAEGQQSGAGGIPRCEPAPCHDQVWPSRPGEPQHGWEPPRVTTGLAHTYGSGREEPEHQHTGLSSEPSGCGAEELGNASEREDNGRESRDLGQAAGEGRGGNYAADGASEGVGNATPAEWGPDNLGRGEQAEQETSALAASSQRQTQPPMGGDADGPAGGLGYAELQVSCDNRTDELRLLGNGVVPATAERAFRTLMEELLKGKN